MLLATEWVLNRATKACSEIYPWIHSGSNHLSTNDQLQGFAIPDIDPSDIRPNSDFSMVAGDFLEVYSTPNQIDHWSAVTTCFFMDTAKNIVDYIEIISKILKPGGIWINIGPLLYHFEGSENSIELNLQEFKEAVVAHGFDIEVILCLII